jgi:hypothetical protein
MRSLAFYPISSRTNEIAGFLSNQRLGPFPRPENDERESHPQFILQTDACGISNMSLKQFRKDKTAHSKLSLAANRLKKKVKRMDIDGVENGPSQDQPADVAHSSLGESSKEKTS